MLHGRMFYPAVSGGAFGLPSPFYVSIFINGHFCQNCGFKSNAVKFAGLLLCKKVALNVHVAIAGNGVFHDLYFYRAASLLRFDSTNIRAINLPTKLFTIYFENIFRQKCKV